MARFYLLNEDHTVTPTDDVNAWARMFEDSDARRVALDKLRGGTTVSTVFLGLDHNFGKGPPLIFETMTFDQDANDSIVSRYANWDDAIAGHKHALQIALNCEAWANGADND